MRKEYTKYTSQALNENMEPAGELEEVLVMGLWADTGMKIRNKTTGLLASGVEFTIGKDSEENYEEVEDPNYAEVIAAIESEVANEL